MEHFESSLNLRNNSKIFQVNYEYLLYKIVSKSANQFKTQACCLKNGEYPVKLNLLEHLHGAKMQCVTMTSALMTSFLRFRIITQHGGYGVNNMTVVIGCYNKLFLLVHSSYTDGGYA